MNINELDELAKAQPKGRVKSDYLAAANPSAISELIAAYLEAVDALREARTADDSGWCQGGGYITEVLDEALATAKRLGVE